MNRIHLEKRILDFLIWKKAYKLYRLTSLKNKKLDACQGDMTGKERAQSYFFGWQNSIWNHVSQFTVLWILQHQNSFL